MMIAMQTEQRFAFGVDEDAAYIWTPEGTYELVSEAVRDGVKVAMSPDCSKVGLH